MSVRLSVKRVLCDKTKETYAHVLIPRKRSLFCDKKNGRWGYLFYLKFWAKLTLLERKRWFSIDIRS